MDSTQTLVLTSFSTRQANSQRGPFTIYELEDNAGTTWQAKKNVFDQAVQLLNQPILASTSVKQNGNYTNYYLNAIAGASAPQNGGGQVLPPPSTVPPVQAAPVASQGGLDAKTVSIHRQCAGKVAAAISTNPGEFWSNVRDIAHYFDTGQVPSYELPMVNQQAAQFNQPQTDDGIPF